MLQSPQFVLPNSIRKVTILAIVFALVMSVVIFIATPASAHSGYASCSASYDPDTFSLSPNNAGTHTHSYYGVYSAFRPKNSILSVVWPNIGPRFWSANGPGSHSGWYQCI